MSRRRSISGLKVLGAVFIVIGLSIIVFANAYLACGSLILVIGIFTFTAGSL